RNNPTLLTISDLEQLHSMIGGLVAVVAITEATKDRLYTITFGRCTAHPCFGILTHVVNIDRKCTSLVTHPTQPGHHSLHLSGHVFILVTGSETHGVEKNSYQIAVKLGTHLLGLAINQQQEIIWAFLVKWTLCCGPLGPVS